MKKFINIFVAVVLLTTFSLSAFAADTELPSDVENLKAQGLNAAVKLTWDEASDDTGVAGYQVHYGLTSVTKKGQGYDEVVDVKDVTQYTVENLENGKKYYFSVIAYDAAKNESESWAIEASATPTGEAGKAEDKTAPTVKKAEAVSQEEVKVEFSEAVVLPEDDPQDAFTIENEDTLELLKVVNAEMDEEDDTDATIILTTDKQKEGQDYKLTVGIDIKDKASNSIVSGTSDTAKFTGTEKQKEDKSGDSEDGDEDKQGPKVVKVESVDNTHFAITFDETIVLSIDPSTNFKVYKKGEPSKTIDVLGVKLGPNSDNVEDATAVITTAPLQKVTYVVEVIGLKDEAGNVVDGDGDMGEFEGKEPVDTDGGDTDGGESDLIPPKDVANFIAKAVVDAKKYVVNLKWEIPAENYDDVVEQILYQSEDKGENYDKKTSIEAGVDEYQVKDLDPGEYWFKITQKDEAGNESKGVVTKVVLAETGPEMIGLLAMSLFLGRVVTRRKRK